MELKYAQLIHKFGQKINVHKPINKDMISKIPSVPPSTSNMLNYLKGVSITLAEWIWLNAEKNKITDQYVLYSIPNST